MKYILLTALLFFSACSVKNYEQTQTKIITIKSPKIKYSDAGYLRNSGKILELELFIAGKSIEKITVNHLICTSEGCMSKSGFNKDYLHVSYPDDTMQNMLLSHVIYDGKNLTKTADGFEQHVKNEDVDIVYKVDARSVYFKDRKNGIIFKIKDTDE
ncbi:MAG: hypothetical protein A2513_10405 [Sulfurimonas sp. RIFOXYD12_FULL_33_39]|uniref:hypothetical protein n=1 Tax=unclassified Sulfurimonas TaxID=2623549 RepID=UPI0008C0D5D8|nr:MULTISPECIES: hypothetical protein [unclassified Sulfurimonas]OHE07017.1 MAG: hypothetical protein A3G74_03455 [Sulfurimonas sp. RIFCSPLOWO2_12_FULL_34_6]OHE09722.1 MAG: hypothetical protein A2513_10405 [Sulfurimonas sp. RIFOXYD12_FULL_33_39]OHE13770.1 MAG: hypothetical protein A2530_09350 [Sulfurimonas sp. RIFOXYD2_FULL_34_21]DAB28694.1 MAG TPA: hypothetical protein CFH78_01075 [Sulfurimonas sp. UBA10385]